MSSVVTNAGLIMQPLALTSTIMNGCVPGALETNNTLEVALGRFNESSSHHHLSNEKKSMNVLVVATVVDLLRLSKRLRHSVLKDLQSSIDLLLSHYQRRDEANTLSCSHCKQQHATR